MLDRPSLPYHYALDIAAQLAHACGGGICLISSGDYLDAELMARLSGCRVDLAASPQDVPAAAKLAVHAPGRRSIAGYRLPAGCRLVLIVSNLPARFLPEWPRLPHPAGGLEGVLRLLARDGLAPETIQGFHGPQAVLWSAATRLAERAGRPELADRFHIRMRQAYVLQGALCRWSAVCLVQAGRAA